MSRENIELVLAGYERLSRGDFAWLDDDFELVTSPENPDAGSYRGEDARRWLATWAAAFEEHTIEATELIDLDDKVVAGITQRVRLHQSDTMFEEHWWQVGTFRDGTLKRVETYRSRAEALNAAGLTE